MTSTTAKKTAEYNVIFMSQMLGHSYPSGLRGLLSMAIEKLIPAIVKGISIPIVKIANIKNTIYIGDYKIADIE